MRPRPRSAAPRLMLQAGNPPRQGLAAPVAGWSSIDCPVCGGRRFAKLFDKQGQDFVRCQGCSLVLINPRPPLDDIRAVYEQSYSDRYVVKRDSKMRRARRRVAQMRRRMPGGRWLDVGCSAGFVLRAAADAGYEVAGVDLDPTGIAHARDELGLTDLHCGALESAGFASGRFDVITLYDVIEHLPDLRATLAELRRVLSRTGVMEIWTPDLDHWRRPKPLESWRSVVPYKHLYYFTQATLTRLLIDARLRVVACPRSLLKPGLRVYVQHAA